MKIYFQKHKEGLFPLYDSDKENLDRIKEGAVFMKNFKKVRNPDFHRLVFDLLNAVFKFQDEFDDFERFRKKIKRLAGCYSEEILEEKDGTIRIGLDYHSWEFGKMDEYEFRDLFVKIKTACCHHFCVTNEQFELINHYD